MMSDKELFNLYVVPNRCYIQRIVRFYAKHNADLVYSDVMEHLYKYIHTYNPEKSSIKSWLYLVIRRRYVRLFQKEIKTPQSDVFDSCLVSYGSYDNDATLETLEDFETIGKYVLSDRLYNALASLNKKKLQAIIYYSNGYTFKAMSKALNVNAETLKARFYTGIKEAAKAYENGVVAQSTAKEKQCQDKEEIVPIKIVGNEIFVTNKNWKHYCHNYSQARKTMKYVYK